ncbi:MAG: restriction endonuclease subunit S [Pyrinomonadaceae bacterium]|nr:restriction endonuclease subunit S [Pyrinomonadaceae bacterium]
MNDGKLPLVAKGWQWRKFGDCAQFINGRAYSQQELLDSGTPVLRIQNLNGGDRWYYSNLRLPEEKYCNPGDLLYAWSASFGPYRFAGPKSIFHYHIWRVIPGAELDKNYAFHLLGEITSEVKSAARGVAMLHMTKREMEAWPIPLPPLREQRRIAEMLDRAEALRAKRRAAVAQLDSLTQSIFLDLFGDPATNPKGWPHKTLFELGKIVTGGTPPSAMPGMFDGPIPFVTPGDLESDEPVKRSLTAAGVEESRTVRAGATLVCCIGATIGKMGVARERSAFNQQLNAVEWSDEVDDLYGYATLRFFKPTIKTWGASTTLPILKKSSFERIQIPVPPLPLQQVFAQRFQAMEKLRATQKESLSALDELFDSIQQRAFRGEL